MSGHSKWASIKHKKGKEDAKRGRIFTRLIREISVAARMGGGDPDANPRLRQVISAARAANMPSDNITRAIKKGTGELEGMTFEEGMYEGYGPGGVAIMLEILTDNKNRSVSDIRRTFSKHGGNMGEAGCVAWMFQKKGMIVVEKEQADEDTMMEVALDAGAEDINDSESTWEVITAPEDLETVKGAMDEKGIKYTLAELSMIPQSTVKLSGKEAEQMLKLMEDLEDSDDVQHVYANFDISEEEMERLSA
jgi:YebC/PmpR family DNA-binding regulatory protein